MPLEQFVETDVDNIVELFKVFNDGTHWLISHSASHHGLPARWCWPTPDAVSQLRS